MILLCQAGTMTHPVPALSAPRYREGTQLQRHQAGVHSLLVATVGPCLPSFQQRARACRKCAPCPHAQALSQNIPEYCLVVPLLWGWDTAQ